MTIGDGKTPEEVEYFRISEPSIGLNQKLLKEEKAFPLFTLDSVLEFEKQLSVAKLKINQEYQGKFTNTLDDIVPKEPAEQISLF